MGTFLLSGAIGFGLGDLALFAALPRIGPRLTVLLVQCLTVPVAAALEWAWLGTTLTWTQAGCITVILAGVALAVAPGRGTAERPAVDVSAWRLGVGFGVGRRAGAGGRGRDQPPGVCVGDGGGGPHGRRDGRVSAHPRRAGGNDPGIRRGGDANPFETKPREIGPIEPPGRWRRGWPWVVANALAGPTLGVSCYQWALATTPSALVLPIVATTPLAVVPLAYFMEGERPGARSLLGGALAVAGAAALAAWR